MAGKKFGIGQNNRLRSLLSNYLKFFQFIQKLEGLMFGYFINPSTATKNQGLTLHLKTSPSNEHHAAIMTDFA